MKLRISGNSIRLRLLRSEVERLNDGQRLAETLYLGPADNMRLVYALEARPQVASVVVEYANCELVVVVPTARLAAWAGNNGEVGMYDTLHPGAHPLEVMIEKDFACLDLSDAENADTFPNPLAGAAC